VQPPNPVEAAERFNEIAQVRDGEQRFEEAMRHIDSRVKRLRYLKPPRTSTPLVYVDLGLSKILPATQMGQAFNRLLHIYAEIVVAQAKILLVDEIENGIYSESLQVIWKGLLTICEQEGVQLFATTHSRECVMAAHAAAKERGKDDLCVQRLQLVKEQVEAVRLGEKHLELAAEMGLEVRS
jgi:ABC-type branched-subunit amino acid transport system ATPase component